MDFAQKLDVIIEQNNSLLCVGLDTDYAKLPAHLINEPHPIFAFNKEIIDATHDLVCSYKLNAAFYEAHAEEGTKQLHMTIQYLRQTYPQIVTIYDAKRGDIGNTNNGYIQSSFDRFGFDAITLHPYMGQESLQPFLDRPEKGCIILCRTSNPGAAELQDVQVEGLPLYQYVARRVSENWNTNGNCLLVVGATYPQELAEVRRIVGDMTLLIPGIGKQGGDLEKTLHAGLNSKKKGAIINSSRGIIFASNQEDFAKTAREEAEKLKNEINALRGV